MTFTAGSLFAGIGGIDLAFQAAGFEIAYQVEIDSYCRAVLQKHWPDVPKHEDVCHVGKHNLPAVDVVVGGFPCQDISIAGKGAGIRPGTRSGLWFEFARIIGELRPRVVFLENVPAITSNGGTTVIGDLAALGYDAEWGIVSAASVGAPHRRERWFCVAYAQSAEREWGGDTWAGRDRSANGGQPVADADGSGQSPAGIGDATARDSKWNSEGNQQAGGHEQPGIASHSSVVVNADSTRQPQPDWGLTDFGQWSGNDGQWGGRTVSGTGRQAVPGQLAAGETGHLAGRYAPSGRTVSGAQSRMGRNADGLSARLDGHQWPARPGEAQHDYEPPRTVAKGAVNHRTKRIAALGNAVVPQVVYPFAVAIREYLRRCAEALK